MGATERATNGSGVGCGLQWGGTAGGCRCANRRRVLGSCRPRACAPVISTRYENPRGGRSALQLRRKPAGRGGREAANTAADIARASAAIYGRLGAGGMGKRWERKTIARRDLIYESTSSGFVRGRTGRETGGIGPIRELATAVPYAAEMFGFTALELIGVTELSFRRSWGYQPILRVCPPTSRYGSPTIPRLCRRPCHVAGGWDCCWTGFPGIFPTDPATTRPFDGYRALRSHADPGGRVPSPKLEPPLI